MKLDNDIFFQYVRMDVDTFNYLLSMVEPYLRNRKKKRDAISAEQRLTITLRYLASGDDILSIAISYRLGKPTVYSIIKRTCSVIHQVLSPIYVRPPCTPVWRNIIKGFEQDWQLPGCIGAVDGKHICIQSPPDSGALFYNYKKFHSIALLAACNHRYEFTVVEVGAYGSESDGGIFLRSEFGKSLDEGCLNIPTESVKKRKCPKENT
ncbi:protein ANTAGONIST OF LIKE HETEROCHROMATIN PROTEIN 1 [Nasonia vitripennis]|uniref:DDE Tnp4 domain-containing protein n=1 Tax=Nasonia vitripennis TaxID=7425 RepID=A0A7M7IZ88_NASVI|nr:protein ANTAGONIST OF LIKE HETEROCHROMATIN PROTEIN 1 [Nasonia vitripennis]